MKKDAYASFFLFELEILKRGELTRLAGIGSHDIVLDGLAAARAVVEVRAALRAQTLAVFSTQRHIGQIDQHGSPEDRLEIELVALGKLVELVFIYDKS